MRTGYVFCRTLVGEVTDGSMPVLITTVQSLHTLEVLKLTSMYAVRPHENLVSESVYSPHLQLRSLPAPLNYDSDDLSELVEASASNNQVKEVRLPRYAYWELPLHIQTRHQQLLKCNEDIDPYT